MYQAAKCVLLNGNEDVSGS
ncbi:hypothetical protein Tco_0553112, partial [Tanacetum coccineum]